MTLRERMREGVDPQISIGEYLEMKKGGKDILEEVRKQTKEDLEEMKNLPQDVRDAIRRGTA